MARPRKLTAEEIAAAQVMWLAGVARKIVADRFHVSERTMYYEMKKLQKPVNAVNSNSNAEPLRPNVAVPSNR